MHNGPSLFVDRYKTLTTLQVHHMAPGSGGLVDDCQLYELAKGREGAEKDQNVPYLSISYSK